MGYTNDGSVYTSDEENNHIDDESFDMMMLIKKDKEGFIQKNS